jgi:uncharacterized membrane protein YjgN (DUF898 family)
MNTDSAALGLRARAADPAAHRIDTRALGRGIEPFNVAFSGSGAEFFRVWIVNLLLTIVTLGFYTPFARRRTAQYFYSHTLVGGSPLEFTGQVRRMFFGFLLLVAIYVAFKLAAQTSTVSIFMLVGALLAPYFWGSAMRFRLGATRWRGVRLQFTARWGEVYRAGRPVFAIALTWFAVGVAFAALMGHTATPMTGRNAARQLFAVPAAAWLVPALGLVITVLCIIRLEFNYKSLLVSRARIGTQAGRWKPVYRDFVGIWLGTVGVLVASTLVFGLLVALVASSFAFSGHKPGGASGVLMGIAAGLAFLLGMLLALAPGRAYRQARMFQLVWNNVGVSDIARFKSNLRARGYVLLRVKNVFLTLLTLGFYRPFALVSEYRMKAESVTLHVKGGLDQLAGQLVREQDGLGDALADVVGLDLVG